MRRSETNSRVQFFQIKAQTVLICIHLQQIFFTIRTDGQTDGRTEKYAEITLHNNRKREKLRERNENNTTITKKYAKQMNWG